MSGAYSYRGGIGFERASGDMVIDMTILERAGISMDQLRRAAAVQHGLRAEGWDERQIAEVVIDAFMAAFDLKISIREQTRLIDELAAPKR